MKIGKWEQHGTVSIFEYAFFSTCAKTGFHNKPIPSSCLTVIQTTKQLQGAFDFNNTPPVVSGMC